MIYESVDLHNIAEVHEIPGHGGVRLQRTPEAVRAKLNERAQFQMLRPGGAEIRFVMESDTASVALSSSDGSGVATVFFGPFHNKTNHAIRAETTTIAVKTPDRLRDLPEEALEGMPFSPRVVRIVLRQGNIHLHGVEGDVRPPRPDETPSRTMLAYGTSITHGAAATAFHLSYVSQTAWRLGADLCNLGVGGACQCESELADHIAERDDWDFATLCLSVNMIGGQFSVDEFRKRVDYLVGRVARANPKRVVVPFTILPHFRDLGLGDERKKVADFRQALRDVVAGHALPNVSLLEGPDLLTDIGGLAVDMIHPGDHGMIEIGERLAARLRPLIGALA
jgi:lysophospholipase L1-like esterase